MTTNVQKTTESATIVNGVVLTDEAINTLHSRQTENNGVLNSELEGISNIVCFIGSSYDSLNEDEQEACMEHIRFLSSLRDWLKTIKKP